MSSETLLQLPISLLERALYIAPLKDWVAIYEIYKQNPELIKALVTSQSDQLFELYRIGYDETKSLEASLQLIAMFSDMVQSVGHIVKEILETRKPKQNAADDKKAQEKLKAEKKKELKKTKKNVDEL